jgi:hypothetical protein
MFTLVVLSCIALASAKLTSIKDVIDVDTVDGYPLASPWAVGEHQILFFCRLPFLLCRGRYYWLKTTFFDDRFSNSIRLIAIDKKILFFFKSMMALDRVF